MRTIFALIWAMICIVVIGFAEPEESGEILSGLLGSAPLTPANQIGSAPLDDMLENVNQSNTALKAAMSFAKEGDYESALGLFTQSCAQG